MSPLRSFCTRLDVPALPAGRSPALREARLSATPGSARCSQRPDELEAARFRSVVGLGRGTSQVTPPRSVGERPGQTRRFVPEPLERAVPPPAEGQTPVTNLQRLLHSR